MQVPPTTARSFLGWDHPLLPRAIDHLLGLTRDGRLDLARTLIVTPGRRAGRMVASSLSASSHRAGIALIPPRYITPGEVAAALLPPGPAEAGPIARRLAWIEALRSIDPDQLRPLIPAMPERTAQWDAIAEQLERTSDQLAGDLLTFANVAPRAPSILDDLQSARWDAASLVQRTYRSILARDGLIDGPLHRAAALLAGPGCGDLQVVLLGIAELSVSVRRALKTCAIRVESLIAAPAPLADRFDDLGCILPDPWSIHQPEIPNDALIFADGPADQAAHALARLADEPVVPTDTVIGIPDPEVGPFLLRLAERGGALRLRDAAGRPVNNSPPGRLLLAAADYLDSPNFANLSSLIRHPDMEHAIRRARTPGEEGDSEHWLSALDAYAAEVLPGSRSGDWPEGPARIAQTVATVRSRVAQILAPLASEAPLNAWAGPISRWLSFIYSLDHRNLSSPSGAFLIESCRRIASTISELSTISPAAAGEPTSASRAIRLVLGALGSAAIPLRSRPAEIEMLGWLEIPIDPASTVIVTGLNEERLAAAPQEPMLPESLRRALGLATAQTRLARDSYLLTSLLASRRRCILIAGRRSADGDPLKPSRLLLSAPATTMLDRISRFFDDRQSQPSPRFIETPPIGTASGFPLCPRITVPGPNRIRVTAFADYIASPYCFYLRHVLNLTHCDDPPDELDPLAYGGLVHHILDLFGRSEARTESDPDAIEQFLVRCLQEAADARFGGQKHGAIELQLQLLRIRLKAFAARQGAWRSQGWLIEHTEWPPDRRSIPFIVDGVPINLSGRIDRIDRHTDGRVAILDYKSANTVDSPEKSHRGRDGWKNLQLPLYRHLAAEIGLPDDPALVTLGYFALPREPEKTGVLAAGWTADDLESADEAARNIVRLVRQGRFGDLGQPRVDEWVFKVLTGMEFPDLMPGEPADDEEESAP